MRLKKYLPVRRKPLNNSVSSRLPKKSLIASISSLSLTHQRQMFQGVCIQIAKTTSHTPVSGMKIFQPKRMIWS
ncbi:Uncharacterised protein [Bordetella pertussis]|nr:Uncharacterised protein [Bordetella pertussis]